MLAYNKKINFSYIYLASMYHNDYAVNDLHTDGIYRRNRKNDDIQLF